MRMESLAFFTADGFAFTRRRGRGGRNDKQGRCDVVAGTTKRSVHMTRTTSLAIRQRGYLLSTEFLLFVTILVMGLLVGWVVLRDSVNAELMDTANAIESSITYYYFNDPDRGNGPDFVNETLQFLAPSDDESTQFNISGDPPVIEPQDGDGVSLGTSATGTITQFPGSESDEEPQAPPAPQGSVNELEGSESGDGN